jgi:hypothetical protein
LNRLRQVDVYIALAADQPLIGGAPLVIDVGYGAYPWTALEMADRWRAINPRLRLLGVEIDPARVAAALPYAAPPQIDFRLGGFDLLTVIGAERARIIRAYNVLRQYEEPAVIPALAAMAAALEEGGLLIEGTCNPSGRLTVFDIYRKRAGALRHAQIVFGTNLRAPAEPEDFRAILPKRLIHHARDPAVEAFFTAWQREFMRWRAIPNRRLAWETAARSLQGDPRYPLERRPGLIRRGYLAVRAPLLPIEIPLEGPG